MNMCGVILPCQYYTLFQTKKAKSITLFQTKTAPEPYPLGRHIPIQLIYECIPLPGSTSLMVSQSIMAAGKIGSVLVVDVFVLQPHRIHKDSAFSCVRCTGNFFYCLLFCSSKTPQAWRQLQSAKKKHVRPSSRIYEGK